MREREFNLMLTGIVIGTCTTMLWAWLFIVHHKSKADRYKRQAEAAEAVMMQLGYDDTEEWLTGPLDR